MPYRYTDYPEKSRRLAAAGQQLLDSLQDEGIDRGMAIQDVETAVQASPAHEATLGFRPDGGGQGARSPGQPGTDDALSGLLLELNSANVLMASGIALDEHGRGSDKSLLEKSVSEVERSRASVALAAPAHGALGFAPAATFQSATLDAAKAAFHGEADGLLKSIVDDSASVAGAIFERFKSLDGNDVLKSIDKLGESFQAAASAGRLIKQGLAKLKDVMDALTKIFGKELLASMRAKISDLWKKYSSGEQTQNLLTWAYGIEGVKARIVAALAQEGLAIMTLDAASNQVSGLAGKFRGNVALLRSLVSGIVLAGTILGVLHFALPWLPLVSLGLYASVLAATVLLGLDYCDSGRGLDWVNGIGDITGEIKPAAPAP